jgi:hypothetical protein
MKEKNFEGVDAEFEEEREEKGKKEMIFNAKLEARLVHALRHHVRDTETF